MQSPASPVWYVPGDDMPMVEPTATRAMLGPWIAASDTLVEGRWLVAVVSTRRRVFDEKLRRRVTRSWRIGHFLIWRDGEAAPTLDLTTYRDIVQEARAHSVDEIVVHGRLCSIGGTSIRFEQFGVRSQEQNVGLVG
ncbi:hypothetical protein FHW79_005419 [Azospirillum sp. OGB3]|uniref:hypothetical protein n=1 Tax=Azospirillum sp. OGB3 TaxID=2587012 RepID=UPI0016066043|nr:hypothetical protein [Azospirillum sp. OGB3]MBB3267754.1 hypothetical protein [Azospirillum sp. OGB3]